jgi:hypothetical protein
MAIPRLRQDAISPTDMIVFPEPPRRAVIKIRGKAMSVVCYYREITRLGKMIQIVFNKAED